MSEFTLKIKLPGYKICLFSLHSHTLELSFGHFQTLKDQGYQKFTQKIDDFDIAETPKMSVFEQKNPTVYRYIQLPTFAFTRLLNKPYENEFTLIGQNLP